MLASLSTGLAISAVADGVTNVVFDFQGGTGGTSETTAENGQAMSSVTTPTRNEWTFVGYYDEPEYTYEFTAGDVSISISPMHYIKNVLEDQQFTEKPTEYKLGQRDTTLALWNLYNKLKVVG